MPTGTYEIFADGFAGKPEFVSTREARFRACGIAAGPDGSLYITDTNKGRIWRVIYTGETAAARPSAGVAPAASAPATDDGSRGAKLYQQMCAACHMPDGSGVPGMQPSLIGNAVVTGDPATLIRAVLHGPAQVLPATRPKYTNQMPPFAAAMNDADLADTLTFVRKAFGKGAPAVSAADVASRR
jgi:mono/diheme cytochrome c family protein